MKSIIIAHIAVFIAVNIFWRRNISEAMDYKRNKKQLRQFRKETPLIWHVLRVYPVKECHAPRHLKMYYFFRVFNLTFLILSIILAPPESEYSFIYFLVYAAILILPVIVELLYLMISSPVGWKSIDFDIYKNP